MASATTPDAIIGIGWSKGMASQGELTEHPATPAGREAPFTPACIPGDGGNFCVTIDAKISGSARRKSPARSSSTAWRSVDSCAHQALAGHSRRPCAHFENCSDGTTWTSKSMSANPSPLNCAREALECSQYIRPQIEPGGHAVHRVDHAANCGMKNAFITLAEVNWNCSGTPAGTVSVLTVATFWSG